MAKPTQKQVVLRELKQAGGHGRRSDFFLDLRIPRAAARVAELKGEGYIISSTRERQFVRYILSEPENVERGRKELSGAGPMSSPVSLDVPRQPMTPLPVVGPEPPGGVQLFLL